MHCVISYYILIRILSNNRLSESAMYTLVMRDVDAPGGNWLNWLKGNIPGDSLLYGPSGGVDIGGFSYMKPSPPTPNQFETLIYKQPSTSTPFVSTSSRLSFDLDSFVAANGLGGVIASHCFVVYP
ncbi:protein D1-like isoform X2 [Saccoglossus kowalevskii]